MSNFFSFIIDINRKEYFFNWEQRLQLKTNKSKLIPDSYTSICSYYGLKENEIDKFEYNPFIKEFTVKQINNKNYSESIIEKWITELNFKTIIEPITFKPFINPLFLEQQPVNRTILKHLNEWIKVRNSGSDAIYYCVLDSIFNLIGDSAYCSLINSIKESVMYPIIDSVYYSIQKYLGDSDNDNINDSIKDSIGYSIWDAIKGYITSFIDIKYKDDYGCLNKLWNNGFIPVFDGEYWYLCSGQNANIVYKSKRNK